MRRKTAILLGATGLTGGLLLRRLVDDERYEKIIAPVRSALDWRHPKLESPVIDFNRLDKERERFRGDELFCCLGSTRSQAGSKEAYRRVDYDYPVETAKLALANGASRCFYISSIGANLRSPFFYLRLKAETENALIQIGYPSIRIFRPSLIAGKRKKERIAERLAFGFFKTLSFFFKGPFQKMKPIAAEALARAIHGVAMRERTGTEIYESDRIQAIAHEQF